MLVEVDCNTDFVARNEDFMAFARDDRAAHRRLAGARSTSPRTRSREDAKDAELRVFEQQAADKPEHIRPKIAEGKLQGVDGGRRAAQPGARQRATSTSGKTIEQLRAEPLRHDRRERRDPALRPLRGRRVS